MASGFLLAQSKAKSTGSHPGLINAYSWMIHFTESDLMNDVKNEAIMKKSVEVKSQAPLVMNKSEISWMECYQNTRELSKLKYNNVMGTSD